MAAQTEIKLSVTLMEQIGNRWTKAGHDRIYFDITALVEMSNSKKRKHSITKLYWDIEEGEFYSTDNGSDEVRRAKSIISDRCAAPASNLTESTEKPFPNAMQTSTGQWVTPDQWDEMEGEM